MKLKADNWLLQRCDSDCFTTRNDSLWAEATAKEYLKRVLRELADEAEIGEYTYQLAKDMAWGICGGLVEKLLKELEKDEERR